MKKEDYYEVHRIGIRHDYTGLSVVLDCDGIELSRYEVDINEQPTFRYFVENKVLEVINVNCGTNAFTFQIINDGNPIMTVIIHDWDKLEEIHTAFINL